MRVEAGGGDAVRGGRGDAEGEEGEPRWLEDDWVVPQTAAWANELWGTMGIDGWIRGQEPQGWGQNGERLERGSVVAEDRAWLEERREVREGGERGIRRGRGSDREEREDRGSEAAEGRATASPRVSRAEEELDRGVEGDGGVRLGAATGDEVEAEDEVNGGCVGAMERRLRRKRKGLQVEGVQ